VHKTAEAEQIEMPFGGKTDCVRRDGGRDPSQEGVGGWGLVPLFGTCPPSPISATAELLLGNRL